MNSCYANTHTHTHTQTQTHKLYLYKIHLEALRSNAELKMRMGMKRVSLPIGAYEFVSTKEPKAAGYRLLNIPMPRPIPVNAKLYGIRLE